MKIAVLLTVYNRKKTTITSLKYLYKAINILSKNKYFDIYLVDDGCTDGTSEAVHDLFPNIKIIRTSGNMYWSKGMRLAWKTALSKDAYDYFIWFNDDAMLYPTSLQELFDTANACHSKENIIISGAFEDSLHNVSYGGRNSKFQLLVPDGTPQPIYYMNGNLVLISKDVVNKIGIIDAIYHHGLGDFDYGLRAIKNNITPMLTTKYVGITDRHDSDLIAYCSPEFSLKKRFKILYSPKFSPILEYKFHCRHSGILKANYYFIIKHIYTMFPFLYKLLH